MQKQTGTAIGKFDKRPTTAKTWEYIFFGAFRAATYLILLSAALIFLRILVGGAPTLFSKTFPFVNLEFLMEKPETLHVFESGEQKMEMGDRDFRAFTEEKGDETIVNHETYVYSAGGVFPAIVGTVLLTLGATAISLLLGILCAIYISEYSKHGRTILWIRLGIMNLAGVPSIVFGLFGMGLFVFVAPVLTQTPKVNAFYFHLMAGWNLSFEGWNVSLLAGWCTLACMVLPVVITACEESLRAVPQGFREGSLALGATQWQTIRKNVLPYALPGILTSSILAIMRVAGETAPIMFTAAYVVSDELPWDNIEGSPVQIVFRGVQALTYHIYVIAAKVPQNEYTARVQYASSLVLLLVVFAIALFSILLRIRIRKKIEW